MQAHFFLCCLRYPIPFAFVFRGISCCRMKNHHFSNTHNQNKLLLTILLVFDVFMRMKRRMCGFQIQKKALTFYSQSLILPLQCLSFMKFYRIVLHPSHRLFDFSIQCPSR